MRRFVFIHVCKFYSFMQNQTALSIKSSAKWYDTCHVNSINIWLNLIDIVYESDKKNPTYWPISWTPESAVANKQFIKDGLTCMPSHVFQYVFQNVTYPAILLDRNIMRYDSEAIGSKHLSVAFMYTCIICRSSNGPHQANLVLIAYASSDGSGEPAHPRSLARTSAARSYKQWVKRNLQTESQIPSPSEWLGMRS